MKKVKLELVNRGFLLNVFNPDLLDALGKQRRNFREVPKCLEILWPGMSRSASTIIGGWIADISTPVIAEYSFFIAIPIMISASGLDLL